MARRALLVEPALQHALLDQPLQARLQHVARDAEVDWIWSKRRRPRKTLRTINSDQRSPTTSSAPAMLHVCEL